MFGSALLGKIALYILFFMLNQARQLSSEKKVRTSCSNFSTTFHEYVGVEDWRTAVNMLINDIFGSKVFERIKSRFPESRKGPDRIILAVGFPPLQPWEATPPTVRGDPPYRNRVRDLIAWTSVGIVKKNLAIENRYFGSGRRELPMFWRGRVSCPLMYRDCCP